MVETAVRSALSGWTEASNAFNENKCFDMSMGSETCKLGQNKTNEPRQTDVRASNKTARIKDIHIWIKPIFRRKAATTDCIVRLYVRSLLGALAAPYV